MSIHHEDSIRFRYQMGRMVFMLICGMAIQINILSAQENDACDLEQLNDMHPRLILLPHRLEALKNQALIDPVLQKYVDDVITTAQEILLEPAIELPEMPNARLLDHSREMVRHMLVLGFAYRWTADQRYADRAIAELLLVSQREEWRPSHFLDTAEMAAAVGIGYDWFFDRLTIDQRQIIRDALIHNALTHPLKNKALSRSNNWCMVSNGGLVIAALAIAESEMELAQQTLDQAHLYLHACLKRFEFDGAWDEGVGYWHYTAKYLSLTFSAMQTALGTQCSLTDMQGISQAPWYIIHATDPQSILWSMADSGGKRLSAQMPNFFYFAKRFNQPIFADSEHTFAQANRAKPQHVIWYEQPTGLVHTYPKGKLFQGRCPQAFFRSTWDDVNALWVGFKGGNNQTPHGHLDQGNFELTAMGVRWALDLGGEYYSVANYWKYKREGGRWDHLRANSHGHNVLLIDDHGQDPLGEATVMDFVANDSKNYCTMDLTGVYAYHGVISAQRGINLFSHKRSLLVQDEITLDHDGSITWGLMTRSEVQITGSEVILSQAGKQCHVKLLSDIPANWQVCDVPTEPDHRSNEGVKRLTLDVTAIANVSNRIAIQFIVQWDDGVEPVAVPLIPLSQW